MTKNKK
jgi:hypothetical protein